MPRNNGYGCETYVKTAMEKNHKKLAERIENEREERRRKKRARDRTSYNEMQMEGIREVLTGRQRKKEIERNTEENYTTVMHKLSVGMLPTRIG